MKYFFYEVYSSLEKNEFLRHFQNYMVPYFLFDLQKQLDRGFVVYYDFPLSLCPANKKLYHIFFVKNMKEVKEIREKFGVIPKKFNFEIFSIS
jgi:hypothetical protein